LQGFRLRFRTQMVGTPLGCTWVAAYLPNYRQHLNCSPSRSTVSRSRAVHPGQRTPPFAGRRAGVGLRRREGSTGTGCTAHESRRERKEACTMCGRYSLTEALDVIVQHFLIQHVGPEVAAGYRPSYNVAPSQDVLVIGLRLGARAAALHRWGLIPSWAKDPSIGYKMINARAETVHERPAYRGPFRSRRCLIPADGLYEWKREGKRKQPYRFLMKDEK